MRFLIVFLLNLTIKDIALVVYNKSNILLVSFYKKSSILISDVKYVFLWILTTKDVSWISLRYLTGF